MIILELYSGCDDCNYPVFIVAMMVTRLTDIKKTTLLMLSRIETLLKVINGSTHNNTNNDSLLVIIYSSFLISLLLLFRQNCCCGLSMAEILLPWMSCCLSCLGCCYRLCGCHRHQSMSPCHSIWHDQKRHPMLGLVIESRATQQKFPLFRWSALIPVAYFTVLRRIYR
jgi:hypothetical protein